MNDLNNENKKEYIKLEEVLDNQEIQENQTKQTEQEIQENEKPDSPKKNTNTFVIILLLIIIAILLLFNRCGNTDVSQGLKPTPLKTLIDKDGVLGDGEINSMSYEEIKEKLTQKSKESMVSIKQSSYVLFTKQEDGTIKGNLGIENPEKDNIIRQVIIEDKETGEQLYISPIMPPNTSIKFDSLDIEMPNGIHKAKAIHRFYNPDTRSYLGESSLIITIEINS